MPFKHTAPSVSIQYFITVCMYIAYVYMYVQYIRMYSMYSMYVCTYVQYVQYVCMYVCTVCTYVRMYIRYVRIHKCMYCIHCQSGLVSTHIPSGPASEDFLCIRKNVRTISVVFSTVHVHIHVCTYAHHPCIKYMYCMSAVNTAPALVCAYTMYTHFAGF